MILNSKKGVTFAPSKTNFMKERFTQANARVQAAETTKTVRNMGLLLLCGFAVLFLSMAACEKFSAADGDGDGFRQSAAGMYQVVKAYFIEGSALFMSSIALSLIVGLAFCLERILYLHLSEINTEQFLSEIAVLLQNQDADGALALARNTRGPVAAICYQATLRKDDTLESIDRSVTSYGNVQTGLLEKNLSWITLFITIAPALGFLGTVIGMIQAFDSIGQHGDISPAIIAGGMKVALITTVAGLIAAIILQVFYNYILARIESLVNTMEAAAVNILDMIAEYK
jgi:biopolymer transport protein ExbB